MSKSQNSCENCGAPVTIGTYTVYKVYPNSEPQVLCEQCFKKAWDDDLKILIAKK